MPIYAYRCAACGAEHEALQKVSDAPLTICPACGQPALAKQVTAAGFQLKGSGWYVTDFRDKGAAKKPDAKPDTAKDKKEGAASEGSKDAATAARSDTPAPSPAPAPSAASSPSPTPPTSSSSSSGS